MEGSLTRDRDRTEHLSSHSSLQAKFQIADFQFGMFCLKFFQQLHPLKGNELTEESRTGNTHLKNAVSQSLNASPGGDEFSSHSSPGLLELLIALYPAVSSTSEEFREDVGQFGGIRSRMSPPGAPGSA